MNIRSQHKPTFEWWDNNNGADYNKYFNIFTFACVNSSSLWYMLSNLSNPPSNRFTTSQYQFISEALLPYTRYTDPTTQSQMGILTPKSLTSTLLFSPDDESPDVRFMNWFENKPTRGSNKKRYNIVNDPSKTLTYHIVQPNTSTYGCSSTDPTSNLTWHFYDVTDNGSTEVNIYPGPGDRDGWKGLLLEWLNGVSGECDEQNNPVMWCYACNKTDNNTCIDEIHINPSWKPKNKTDVDGIPLSYTNWLKKSTNKAGAVYYGQADNFMSRFGIMPDSPLFLFFTNNNYIYNGHPVDTDSFKQLVGGSGGNAGGWVGFLAEHANWDREDFIHLLESKVGFPAAKSLPCSSQNKTLNAVMTGVGVLANMFLMGMFLLAPEVAAPAAAAGAAGGVSAGKIAMFIGIAVMGTAASVVNSATSQC